MTQRTTNGAPREVPSDIQAALERLDAAYRATYPEDFLTSLHRKRRWQTWEGHRRKMERKRRQARIDRLGRALYRVGIYIGVPGVLCACTIYLATTHNWMFWVALICQWLMILRRWFFGRKGSR